MNTQDQDLTEDEIAYLLMFGFEPIVKIKTSEDNQTFTADLYVPVLS